MPHFCVIGAGQAGASLVIRLRKQGFDGRITLIGEEPVPPYQRPPLSKKYLTGGMKQEQLYLRPAQLYADLSIDLKTNLQVSRIDRATRTIEAQGQVLTYDKLALTTGSAPIRLRDTIGGALAGVYTVRTLADVDAMADEFQPGRRLLIVGGGYIGLETAAVAAGLGLKVTLVEQADRILKRVAAPETADYFRNLHTAHGVEIKESTGLVKLKGEDRVTQAELSDGTTLNVDFVVAGIGIRPETELAKRAGLEVDNGIAVDAFGTTSDPNIYAAGDCCSFPYQGGRLRLESVPNAIDQAESAADAMIGNAAPYEPKIWFWSDQYDTKLQIAGLNTGYDRIIRRQTETATSVWYFRMGRLVSVDAMSDARAYMMGKRWIESGQSPAPKDLLDSSRALKDLSVS